MAKAVNRVRRLPSFLKKFLVELLIQQDPTLLIKIEFCI